MNKARRDLALHTIDETVSPHYSFQSQFKIQGYSNRIGHTTDGGTQL